MQSPNVTSIRSSDGEICVMMKTPSLLALVLLPVQMWRNIPGLSAPDPELHSVHELDRRLLAELPMSFTMVSDPVTP